jgi:hypothetical protein
MPCFTHHSHEIMPCVISELKWTGNAYFSNTMEVGISAANATVTGPDCFAMEAETSAADAAVTGPDSFAMEDRISATDAAVTGPNCFTMEAICPDYFNNSYDYFRLLQQLVRLLLKGNLRYTEFVRLLQVGLSSMSTLASARALLWVAKKI